MSYGDLLEKIAHITKSHDLHVNALLTTHSNKISSLTNHIADTSRINQVLRFQIQQMGIEEWTSIPGKIEELAKINADFNILLKSDQIDKDRFFIEVLKIVVDFIFCVKF